MVKKIGAVHLDYNNDQPNTQAIQLDTFFQNNTVLNWTIDRSSEIMLVHYDEGVTAGATRFRVFDVTSLGIPNLKADLNALNTNTTVQNWADANDIERWELIGRYIIVQYKASV